ncbi:hypothetical protein JTB14_015386 [Gonioctena quinquepunctata]|nr:hypothetical protein JTB14_015386 [Gonioctena quinquepunctata]
MDSETWKVEAKAVINDVKDHVKLIVISSKLASDNRSIYLNLITCEDKYYCIQLSSQGFKVVGYNFDDNNIDSDSYFETPYSLLSELSVGFKNSFANALIKKLADLA